MNDIRKNEIVRKSPIKWERFIFVLFICLFLCSPVCASDSQFTDSNGTDLSAPKEDMQNITQKWNPTPEPNWKPANDGIVDVKVYYAKKPFFSDKIWYATTYATRYNSSTTKHYKVHCWLVDIEHNNWLRGDWNIPVDKWKASLRFYPHDAGYDVNHIDYDWDSQYFRWCAWYEEIP